MRDEPKRHPMFMLLLAACALATVPFAFVGVATRCFLGLPLWLWSSALATFAFSVLIAWGVLRYWRDDDE